MSVLLSEVVAALPECRRFGDATLVDCSADSRKIGPGWLFAAVPGTRIDGHEYASAAVRAGAAALLVQRRLPLPVPQAVVPSVAAAVGPVAAAIHHHPGRSLDVVGITGTNGKTMTAYLVRAALTAAGWRSGLIGTVETIVGDDHEPALWTTPPAPELQRALARMRAAGMTAAVMEASSHGLDQHRLGGVEFAVGVFTNLRPEHLDYHGTVEQYYAAKVALFTPGRCRHGLVCVDDEWGRRLADHTTVPVTTYGRHSDADVRVDLLKADLDGIHIRLDGANETAELSAPLVGQHQAANLAGAYLAARALGAPRHDVRTGVSGLAQVPGRFERVDRGQPFAVVVDFAHTPDALGALIATGRRVAPEGRVIVVIGAAGGRDRFNRPELGRTACTADLVVLTTDDPGDDDRHRILAEVQLGALGARDAQVWVEPDRATALHAAVAAARAGDIVLIAGRGHESHQRIDGRLLPFDDRDVAQDALAEAGWSDQAVVCTERNR